ncbi:MAG: hypothetical protein H8E28_16030 [Anaerolineae bacterium]|nr:hypothetical protein [Anaerolineae bacterium]
MQAEKQSPRNPVTQQTHRKESLWQIWLPLSLGVLIILGLAAWSVIVAAGGGDVSQPADASLILVLCPSILMAVIPLALVGGFAYGTGYLVKILPPKMLIVQYFFTRIEEGTHRAADKLAEPSLKMGSFAAAWRAFRSAFRPRRPKNS